MIRGNGFVGIGTTDPQQALDVAGDIRLTGLLELAGTSKIIRGGSTAYEMAMYPNTSAWDSRNWVVLYGDHPTRAGELDLAGSYINFRHGVTTEGWGMIGMRLASNGNLGIGTTDPAHELDVAGNVKISGNLIGGADDVLGIYLNTNSWDSRSYVEFQGAHATRAGELALAGSYIDLRYGSTTASWGTIGMRLASNGNVGIGTTTPQYKVDVAGTIRGDNVSPSDIRWKEAITPCDDALDRVMQLRGVTFRWNDPSRGTGPQIGVIAQEVEQVFPELVSTDSEGYKSVAYDRLVAPLIEAVKAIKTENDALKAENSRMKEEFERRLTALEAIINQP